MKKNIMEKWVKALRSGKYKQGKGYLNRYNDTFCCLGVLCELYNNHLIWSDQEGIKRSHVWEYWYNYDGLDSSLPKCVMEWAGISTSYGDFNNNQYLFEDMNKEEHLFSLAQYNDGADPNNVFVTTGKPKTFNEIADIIASNYSRL